MGARCLGLAGPPASPDLRTATDSRVLVACDFGWADVLSQRTTMGALLPGIAKE